MAFKKFALTDGDHYKTSYARNFYYKNLIDQNPVCMDQTREIPKEIKEVKPINLDMKTTYNKFYDTKYWDHSKVSDYYRRYSAMDRTTLRSMHEKYIKNPVKPLKIGTSTTGRAYMACKEIHVPVCLPNKCPAKNFTCPIRAFGRDEFPSIPPNEIGHNKHLDPFVSTTQLTHVRFTLEQQNGVSRKNVITFYDTVGIPKVRGFGPKKMIPIGSYFQHKQEMPYRVLPKRLSRIPHRGMNSTYKEYFHPAAKNTIPQDVDIQFPSVSRSSLSDVLVVPGMYCTEQCHIGTGWPIRAAVDIGTRHNNF